LGSNPGGDTNDPGWIPKPPPTPTPTPSPTPIFGVPTLRYLEFDGNNDYVTGSADFNFGTSDFTFEAWARVNDLDVFGITDRKIFHYNVSGGTEAVWHVRQNGKKLKINTFNGTWLSVVTDDDVFDDTDWHHVALVRVGAAVTIYVDGALQTTTGNIHATLSTSVNDTFYVGSQINRQDPEQHEPGTHGLRVGTRGVLRFQHRRGADGARQQLQWLSRDIGLDPGR